MVTEEATTRAKPLLSQGDLRNVLVASRRILTLREMTPYLRRDLSRAERQLLSICAVVCELIRGEYGEDDDGPIGDLTLKAQPYISATYQPKLGPGGNGK